MNQQKLTIAAPVYNEERLIGEFITAVDQVVAGLKGYEVDLLLVNDGSRDHTVEAIEGTRIQHLRGIRLINLSRNVGHPFAVQCLVDHLTSPVNILMDADFQDDPATIPQMLEVYATTGSDVVRIARAGQSDSLLNRTLYKGFRYLFRRISRGEHDFGTFGLYSLKAVEHLRRFAGEAHPYFPGLVNLVGLKSAIVSQARSPRKLGKSRMGTQRLFRVAFDAIFSFSVSPIRLASLIGLTVTLLGGIGILVILYIRLFTNRAIVGWSSVLSAIMFFGGLQLLFLGILGEYVARIFEQVKNRPHYLIDSTVSIPGSR